jgi:mannosyltransferase
MSVRTEGQPESQRSAAPLDGTKPTPPAGLRPRRRTIQIFGALILVGAVVARFVVRSPLWLDEALSVNIAKLPLGQIPGALRHDGHPPLYYFLLHGWMRMFGEGDVAVRALSGLFGVAVLPLTFLAGRRLGGQRTAWIAAALMGTSPFAIRYSSETRMYSLVMVLTLAGWLLGDSALRRPTLLRLAGIALITGMLLLSHYWAMWLLAAVGVTLLVRLQRAHRQGRIEDRTATLRVLVAIGIGALAFAPWLPSLLYQGRHTGTPWALPVRPAEIVSRSLADFGGGSQGEAICFGWLLALLVLLGVFGRRVDDRHVELDLHTRPESRPVALLLVLTISIAAVAGYATNSTYATRYAAVFFPFFILLAALGLSRLGSRRVMFAALAVLIGFALAGDVREVLTARTQASVSARAIRSQAKVGDYVVYCPDQLGPGVSRVLPSGYRQVTYPRFEAPQRVDWVDYVSRLHRQSPDRFADELLRRAGNRAVFLVWDSGYRTHKEICPELVNALIRRRPGVRVLSDSDGGRYFENEAVYDYPPAAAAAP